MELEEKIWNDVLKIAKYHRRLDKKYIEKRGGVPPNVIVFRYCHECDQVTWNLGIFRADSTDVIKRGFKLVMMDTITRPERCDKCDTLLLPIGYSWNSLAWMLSSKPEEAEEVKEYYRVMGGIEKHPNRIETYVSCIVTMLGKKVLYFSEIRKEKSKVTVEDSDREVERPESGPFIIKLPRIHVTKEGISFGD